MKRHLIKANPFADMKGIAVKLTPTVLLRYTGRSLQVIDACPDSGLTSLFALSRFGGLRCPSEHLTLRWSDVDLPGKKMTVRSSKTEAYEGKATRVVPIFPELMPYLQAAWTAKPAGGPNTLSAATATQIVTFAPNCSESSSELA